MSMQRFRKRCVKTWSTININSYVFHTVKKENDTTHTRARKYTQRFTCATSVAALVRVLIHIWRVWVIRRWGGLCYWTRQHGWPRNFPLYSAHKRPVNPSSVIQSLLYSVVLVRRRPLLLSVSRPLHWAHLQCHSIARHFFHSNTSFIEFN